jgi:erythromycin esterase-like protein
VVAEQSSQRIDELVEIVRDLHCPLRHAEDLDPLLERVGDARYVLLGEASHGTSEYYTWRARISKRLILEKGFSFIAVEGDWPDCYRGNRYVKGLDGGGRNARAVLHSFDRWPTWMWANWETVALLEWLRRHNETMPADRRVGFYGLDVYSLWDSLRAVMEYVSRDGQVLHAAKTALKCFQPFGQDAITYARATSMIPVSCQAEVSSMLAELRRSAPRYSDDGNEGYFDAEQNALIVKNAEQYYRTMVRADNESWNVRDRHMVETLERLTQFHGPAARAIVWAHNTHVGDARATDMAASGMLNVGQLVREMQRRDDVVIVGFGSHGGTVIAGRYWDAPMERMLVPPAQPASWEDVFCRADCGDLLLLLDPSLPQITREPRGQRAIGVVYDPERERYGNYVPTILPRRYDAFIHCDVTRALHPLHLEPHVGHDPPETYPWGV